MKVGDLRTSIIDRNLFIYDNQRNLKSVKLSKGEIILLLERTRIRHVEGYELEAGGCWFFLKEGQIFLLPSRKILQWTRACAGVQPAPAGENGIMNDLSLPSREDPAGKTNPATHCV